MKINPPYSLILFYKIIEGPSEVFFYLLFVIFNNLDRLKIIIQKQCIRATGVVKRTTQGHT